MRSASTSDPGRYITRSRITDTVQFPRLIAEVLSSSTEAYDRGRKFAYYLACPTVLEYVLIDTQRQVVEVYRRQSDTLWTLHPFGHGDQIELASLSLSFPIAALYEDIGLLEDTPGNSHLCIARCVLCLSLKKQ